MLLERSSGHSLPQNTFWKASSSDARSCERYYKARSSHHSHKSTTALLSPMLSPTLESSGTSGQCMDQSHTKLWAPGKVTSGMSQSRVIIAWADGESKIPIFGVKPPWWYQFSLCPMLSSVIKASRPSVWHQTQSNPSKVAGQMLETLVTTARVVFYVPRLCIMAIYPSPRTSKNLQVAIAVLKKRRCCVTHPLRHLGML